MPCRWSSRDLDVAAGEPRWRASLAPVAADFACNGATLRADVPINADGVFDLDVRTARVRGAATLNGAARTGWSGSLVFAPASGGDATVRLDAGGRYDVLLAAGTYDISWSGLACAAGSPFPCNGGALRTGVPLTSDGVLDVDMRAARIRGAVTLNGGPLPASARGRVAFDDVAGRSFTAAIAAAGAGTYDTTVLPGAYVVSHQGPGTGCDAVPCMQQRLRGCP